MFEGKNVPYQYGGCQADSVQHGHYDAGGYCSGGSDKNYDQSMVLLNSQTGGRNKKQFMLWTRMQIDWVKIGEAIIRMQIERVKI